MPSRSDVSTTNPVPTPPFWGDRIVKGVPLADFASYLDERATFMGQWGLKASRGGGPSYEELVETEGRPRLRAWLTGSVPRAILEPAVVYGYWPCYSDGDDLVVLDAERHPTRSPGSRFPRQRRDRFLCLSDFFRPKDSGELDVVAFQLVTMGSRVSEVDREAVRSQRLPRLPRAARALGPAHGGARRVLARPGARRARVRCGRLRRHAGRCSGRATAARGTASAIRPAPTSSSGPPG